MKFDKDLFISYAHIDNEPLTPDQKGWITRFHSSLEALLSMRLGGEARIWRDEKLQGNDVFADEIVDQFGHTAVIISVLTPRYLNSEWCTREITEFCRQAQQSGGIVVENKSRVFKVLKTPVESQDSLPEAVKDVLGYEFFTYEDEIPLELDPAYGEQYAQDYNRKVGKLAWEIAQMLKRLNVDGEAASGDHKSDTDESVPVTSGPTVYLAECSYDQKQSREILESALKHHGYAVLPDKRLPRDEEDYVAAVNNSLECCQLSIHLVGDTYGGVPDGPTQKSVVMLQNEQAAQRSKSGGLRRVIWLPEGTHSEHPQQQTFIDTMHQDDQAQFGADLITGDIETLKSTIFAAIKQIEEAERQQPEKDNATADGRRQVYLVCNEKDRKATVTLRKFCRDQGFDVAIPAFQGDAKAIREAHHELMANCDAVILFYGAGGEGWKRTLDSELKKMPGYRAGKPLPAQCTYLAAPATADKEDLIDMEESGLIDGIEDFPEASVATFLQSMKQDGAAT